MKLFPFRRIGMLSFACCGLVALGGMATAAEPQLAHMVYFSLKDDSSAASDKLVAACNKHLSGHEGTVYYSAGVRAREMDREVNDRQFDVALNLVFKDIAALNRYMKHPRHLKFIAENRETWAKVRVFDSYVTPPASR